jgi:hypothetical protein
MELQTFEQAILKLAFETDARITTASVAYYLGIPSREATLLLNNLLGEGVLELDSDPSGNLFYRVPNKPSEGDNMGLRDLRDAKMPPPLPSKPLPRPSAAFMSTTLDDDEDGDGMSFAARPAPQPAQPGPASSTASVGEHVRAPESSPLRSDAFGKPWGQARDTQSSRQGFTDYYGNADGEDGSASGAAVRAPTFRPSWPTVSTRVASPDASLDRCGSSGMIVSTKVRCEPRPLPEAKPMIVSCGDSLVEQRQEQSWFGAPSTSTALAEVGDTALAREYYIEQPEHQPGMALLLSLILCGTGQIYNGEVSKGIMMMVLCFLLWFVLLGWVVHIWSIVDAVVVAERLNRRHG